MLARRLVYADPMTGPAPYGSSPQRPARYPGRQPPAGRGGHPPAAAPGRFPEPPRTPGYYPTGGPASPQPGVAVTASRWSYLWAVLPFISFGLAGPVPFGYAAIRRRSAWLAAATAGYLGLEVAAFIVVGPGRIGALRNAVIVTAWLACWLVATGHAFAIRRRVFDRPVDLDTDAPSDGHGVVPVAEAAARLNARAVDRVALRKQLRRQAKALAGRDPAAAAELGIGRPDRPTDYDDGGLIDLNHAPAAAIATIPGVDDAAAAAIVEARNSRGAFTCAAEVDVYASLSPALTATLDEYGVFLP